MMNSATLRKAYQDGDRQAEREQLLARHLRLVYHIARKLKPGTPATVELDDLVSAGTIGLIRAVESYDPSLGYAFSTFAAPRIRGAMLDDLRRWDHASRSARRKQREIARARERLERDGRAPADAEVAGELGLDLSTYWRWTSDVQETERVSLDRPIDPEAGVTATPLQVLAGEDDDPADRLADQEERDLVRDAILALPERERLVLSLCYYEEMKLREIGEVLGLTESRVSQIRSRALAALRERLAEREPRPALAMS